MLSRLAFIILIFLLVETYSFFAIKRVFNSKKAIVAYVVCSLLILVYFIYTISGFNRFAGQSQHSLLVLAFLLLYLLTKATVSTFLLMEDLYRIFALAYNFFFRKENQRMIPSRRKF